MNSSPAHSGILLASLLVTGVTQAAFPNLESDGNFNSGFGSLTLQFVSGQYNTASGYEALGATTIGIGNTATGYQALAVNAEGGGNTAIGMQALLSNTVGFGNTASGFLALSSITSGSDSTAVGYLALYSDIRGDNTAVGSQALYTNTNGVHNVATGGYALWKNTVGVNNTATGYMAMGANTTGSHNTSSGGGAMGFNTTGKSNTALGYQALYKNTTGSQNTVGGANVLYSNKSGVRNTAFGINALYNNSRGSGNIALGASAGKNLTTGSDNIAIGNAGVAAEEETIRIGSVRLQRRTFIAGINGVTIASGATVLVNAAGQLGVQTSSQKFKENIRPMGDASTALMKLEPVTFHYKEADEHGHKPVQFGLIAEQVASVFPELVVSDQTGKPQTVAYQALTSLLLNEFQKEHQQRLVAQARFEQQLAAIQSASEDNLVQLRAQLASREQELRSVQAALTQLQQATRQLLTARPLAAGVAQVEP